MANNLDLTQTADPVVLAGTVAQHERNVALDQTCAATLSGMLVKDRALHFDQTCAPVGLTFTAGLGRVFKFDSSTAEARLTSWVEVGDPPLRPPRKPGLYNLTGRVLDSGGAILSFIGPPWRSVEWRIISGTGTLTPFTAYTDALGRSSCRFDAGWHGHKVVVVVGVAYVP